ncbi:hypothetical protein SADUNF_Sadunf01G0174400 [Salix dunnii]|uniref:TF-B3 domain-containing protein n=1 Tax=Salix dunnii TaxID=1413687 RepID=A0A835NCQ5_9ROSI|nr:hypothetical protein SADUNF_Sadunf01G0174400 [Salix dunnii]
MTSREKLLSHCSSASPKKKKEKKKLAMENITKKLNSTDVERRLLLPENCLQDLRSDLESNLKFKDEEGQVWTFRCRASSGGRSKPAFYGDWFTFVRVKGLRVGDVVVIISDKEKNMAAGGSFKIKIKKSASKHHKKE